MYELNLLHVNMTQCQNVYLCFRQSLSTTQSTKIACVVTQQIHFYADGKFLSGKNCKKLVRAKYCHENTINRLVVYSTANIIKFNVFLFWSYDPPGCLCKNELVYSMYLKIASG